VIDSARAQQEFRKILADQPPEVQDMAARLADDVWSRVQSGAKTLDAVQAAMSAGNIEGALRTRLGQDVVRGLLAGAGVLPQAEDAGVDIAARANKALSLSWDGSGMTLSETLHGSVQRVQAELVDSIGESISRRDTAWNAARQIYDGYGFGGIIREGKLSNLPGDLQHLTALSRAPLAPLGAQGLPVLGRDVAAVRKYAEQLRTGPLRASYLQLLDRLESGLDRGMEKAIRTATEEKARYNAERILRTETARAWGEGFYKQIDEDPDAVGLKWSLSSAHKIFDICDFHARADLFGMGPGRFPKNQRPNYPAHPHCTCNLTAVYIAPDPHDHVEEGGRKVLDGMSAGERARLLGKQGADRFKADGSWQSSMREWERPRVHVPVAGAQQIVQDVQDEITKYRPAASIAEAEKLARQWNLADAVSYKGFDLEAANGLNRVLFDHVEQFPELRKGLQFVGTSQERNRRAKALRRAEGWPEWRISAGIGREASDVAASSTDSKHKQFEGVLGIAFNQKLFSPSGYPSIRDAWKSMNSGLRMLHPPGKDAITDVTSHELGHQLDAVFGLDKDPGILAAWSKASGSDPRFMFSMRVENISSYAAKRGLTEGIAEGWAEAYGSSSPREFAIAIRERILTLRRRSP